MAGGNKANKKKKDKENATNTRTSPRKHKTQVETEPAREEERREQDVAVPGGSQGGSQSGPRAGIGIQEELEETRQLLSEPFTDEQEEQITSFFEEHKFYYDMADSDYKNKRKRENLLLEFARTMFTHGKCIFLLLKFVITRLVSNSLYKM